MVPPVRPRRIAAEAPSSSVLAALQRHGDGHRARFGSAPDTERVLGRLLACRTGELGVHECLCVDCGWSGMVGDSCGDRHCPQCQGRMTAAWVEARQERMLAVPHFQVVFTLPAELRPLARCNPKELYGLLFQAGTSVLQDLATQRWAARPGITAALHSRTSEMAHHPRP